MPNEIATPENSSWVPGMRLMRKGGNQTCVVCGSWDCHDDLTCSIACKRKLDSRKCGFAPADIKYRWVFFYRCAECGREGWFAGRSRVYCSVSCANKKVGARRRDNPLKLAYVCAWCGELRLSNDDAPRQFCRPICQRMLQSDLAANPKTPRPPDIDAVFRKKWKEADDWQTRQALAKELRVATAQAIERREVERGETQIPLKPMTFTEFTKLEQAVKDRQTALLTSPAILARARRILEDESAPENVGPTPAAPKEAPAPTPDAPPEIAGDEYPF